MKVHTKLVIQMSSGEVLEDECYEYDGPVAQCLGLPAIGAIGGALLGGFGSRGGSQTTTTQAQVPPWLLPLLQQQAGAGQGALGQLEGLLGGQTVAGFNPDQLSGINLGRDRAMGAGGFFPTAQQQFLQTAQGQGGLPLGNEGINALRGFAGGQVPGLSLGNQGIEQLQRTASGDFLSSPGFQSAFEGALRQAQPQIAGAFSLAGRTGSGLAQTAQTQAAADSFAGLFNQERQRQVGAGSQLAGLADIGLGRQIQAQLGAGGQLAGMGDIERSRQLQAASFLPQLAGMDVNMLQQIGGMQQQQQQAELMGPILAQMQLLGASGGGVNLGALLGQQTTQPIHGNPLMGALGGGLMGARLGGLFPGPTPLQLSGPF